MKIQGFEALLRLIYQLFRAAFFCRRVLVFFLYDRNQLLFSFFQILDFLILPIHSKFKTAILFSQSCQLIQVFLATDTNKLVIKLSHSLSNTS